MNSIAVRSCRRAGSDLLWIGAMWRAVIQASPRAVLSCIVLLALSQVSLLAALLLPWKMLVVLNARAVPDQWQFLWDSGGLRTSIAFMMAAALLCFALHLAAEAIAGRVCRKGAEGLLEQHRKTGLHDSLHRQAATYYRRLLYSLAQAFSCLVIAAGLLWLHPGLLACLALYIGCSAVVLAASLPGSKAATAPAQALRERAWWGLGFLCLAAWTVRDFLEYDLPSFLIAFAALLMGRQALVLVCQLHRLTSALLQQRNRVEAVFLGHRPIVSPVATDQNLADLLKAEMRAQWLSSVLMHYGGRRHRLVAQGCVLAQSGKVLYLTAEPSKGEGGDAVMLKLFHSTLKAFAEHERDILRHARPHWPAPTLLGEHKVEGHLCLAYAWPQGISWQSASGRVARLTRLRQALMACDLPAELVERYDRSHAPLSDRLRAVDWPLLCSIAQTSEMQAHFAMLERAWPELAAGMDELPRHLVLNKLSGRMTSQPPELLLCNWTDWRWEPLGAGWPCRQQSIAELQKCLNEATTWRPELVSAPVGWVWLAALLHEFDQRYSDSAFLDLGRLAHQICRHLRSPDWLGGQALWRAQRCQGRSSDTLKSVPPGREKSGVLAVSSGNWLGAHGEQIRLARAAFQGGE